MEDYYQIFEISPNASQDEIKEQYFYLAHTHHPDKYKSAEHKARAEERFKKINEAYQVLSNPSKRAEYDRNRPSSQSSRSAEENRREREQSEFEKERQRQKEQAEAERRQREREEQEKRRNEQAEAERQQAEFEQRKREQEELAKKNRNIFLIASSLIVVLCVVPSCCSFIGLFSNSTNKTTASNFSTPSEVESYATEQLYVTEPPIEKQSPNIVVNAPAPDKVNQTDGAGLMRIPAGEFTMGSATSDTRYTGYYDPNYWGAEAPMHQVILDEYLIYQTEVTNAMYQKCVAEQKCSMPEQIYSATRTDYYNNPMFSNYPVIYVSYNNAQSYCNWANAELPTEAQWEKAARGIGLNLYPWGNDTPTDELAGWGNDTSQVGSFPQGASHYGVLDMAGNVTEWVFDVMSSYPSSLQHNPKISSGSYRNVVRGGNYLRDSGTGSFRVSARTSVAPNLTTEARGFRCVINP